MSVETRATGSRDADISERLLADVQQALASNTPTAKRFSDVRFRARR